MTYDTLKAIIDEVGEEKVLALFFDNNRTEYFPDGDFSMNDVKNIGGELVYVSSNTLSSKCAKGGYLDVPVKHYNSELQSVLVLENESDRDRLDVADLYQQ